MEETKEFFTFILNGNSRNFSSEFDDEINTLDVNAWEDAQKFLSNHTYFVSEEPLTITANWKPFLQNIIKIQRYEKYPVKENEPLSKIKIKLSCTSSKKINPHNQECVLSYLYDVFLIMNISSPGSCDFYKGQLKRSTKKRFKFDDTFESSNSLIEGAYLDSLSRKTPILKNIPIQEVANWYYLIRPNISLVPKNKIEVVLFDLMYILNGKLDPMIVIWFFHALETLFETKAGENFRVLTERIKLLLRLSNNEFIFVKSKMRKIYDIRSGIVHGGFKVSHVVENELIDSNLLTYQKTIFDVSDFIAFLLIRCLQDTIINGWKWPEFTEHINGVPIDKGDKINT